MTTPTDLIAQAEAVMHPETIFVWINPSPDHYGGGWDTDPTNRNIRYVRGDKADALIARIRELEGERDEWIAAYRSCAKDTLELTQRAEAAEAKLAEVTASNAEWTEFCVKVAQDEMRAIVATLTAQVEAMRVSAMKAMTIANGALDPTATEKTFRRDLVQIREELRGALWPAALTTEDHTNG